MNTRSKILYLLHADKQTCVETNRLIFAAFRCEFGKKNVSLLIANFCSQFFIRFINKYKK
jgi:hypothetical protein